MATPKFEELQKLAADLQTSLDAKQEIISAKIEADNAKIAADIETIAALQAIIDAGTGSATTDAQLQGVIDSLTTSKNDLEATATA